MSTATFVGIALELESLTQIALATIRVRFTQDPLQSSPTGANDALNPLNWTLSGPGNNIVTGCNTVAGDTQSIDLFLAGPLATGTWTVTASIAIQTALGSPIQAPTSLQIVVTNSGSFEPVNVGSVNDADSDIIRKHLNRALSGPGWDALIAALATGEATNRNNAQLAFNQLFTSTASGLYLDRKASDNGIQRPINMGMADSTFSNYAIRLTNDKLTEESLLEILQVFYGDASLRASSVSSKFETFPLQDGDNLTILIDESVTVSVVFSVNDFAIIGQARAMEVAASITRACRAAGSKAYAAPTIDPVSGNTAVTIYSSSLGLSSGVRILGGRAQTKLQFPTLLSSIYTGATTPIWNITVDATRNIMRFTTTGFSIDLSQLFIGDYVNIYGTEFLPTNQGSFTITNVVVTYSFIQGPTLPLLAFAGSTGQSMPTQYFEVINSKAVAQNALVQTSQNDVLYFRPTKASINATNLRTVLVSALSTEVDVLMPATSPAVSRQELTGAYLPVQSAIAVTSLERINGTVTAIAPSHGFSVGDLVIIDGSVGNTTLPAITNGNGTTTTNYSWVSTASVISAAQANQLRTYPQIAKFIDGTIYVSGGVNSGASNLNSEALQFSSSSSLTGGVQYTLAQPAQSATGATFSYQGLLLSSHPVTAGKLIQWGGTDLTNDKSTTEFISNGSFSSGPALSFAVAAPMGMELNNKTIISFGGAITGVGTKNMQIFSPATNAWTNPATPMNEARVQSAVVHTKIGANEAVYVIGGRSLASGILNYTGTGNMGPISNTYEAYQPSIPSWTVMGRMSYARFGHQAFLLSNGNILVIGGWGYHQSDTSTTPTRLATCEVIDAFGSHPIGSMRNGRAFFAAGIVGTKLYVAGGTPSSTAVEILDLTTLTWSISTATLNLAVDKTAGAILNNTMLVVVGGEISGNPDSNYRIVSIASETVSSSNLNGQQKVASVVNGNTFTFTVLDQTYMKTGTCTATTMAEAPGKWPGPFMFDVKTGVAVTGVETTITQSLNKRLQYSVLNVTNALLFPDAPGYLVFDFGFSDSVYPIKYLGRLSPTQLELDASYTFLSSIANGAKVCLLQQNSPWVPSNPAVVGAFYLTDSPSGRIAASAAIDSSAGSGLTVNKTIIYPGDRGLGNEGFPSFGNYKVSDKVAVWGSSDMDGDLETARGISDGD
jgi:hypothetical protein